jgi:putative selenate reductase
MAELIPAPLSHHIARISAEWRARRAIFDLPERGFWKPEPGRDLSVRFHGMPASTPTGPSAGPQSQMAQNLVLAWLAGARVLELKTVQILDRLVLSRPCIDVRNVGFNVEWSQELRLEDSLSEYVNGWILVALLRALGLPSPEAAGPRGETLFDLSVGYDLKGISSDRIRRFLDAARDVKKLVEARRASLPPTHRDLPVDPAMVKSVTLSTFHGCPADEIEKIGELLLTEVGLHTTIKLNPTLLGFERVRHLLHDVLGYRHLELDPAAFEKDLQFPDAVQMIGRLSALAARRSLGFAVKLCNTLVVKNRDTYFQDAVMFASGQPLFVLAVTLAQALREAAGSALPISFSAGIDQKNFPDAVALGFVPVTASTDLLRPGGYARMSKFLRALEERMATLKATTVEEYVLCAGGHKVEMLQAPGGDREQMVREAARRNGSALAQAVQADPRFHHLKNRGAPRKIGSTLHLFDCISCDKCVPVCPNDANFFYETPAREIAQDELCLEGSQVREIPGPRTAIARAHQIANFADFCNECGNCDVFCPEDGGPFVEKPRFFGSLEAWRADFRPQGFHLERLAAAARLYGRRRGAAYLLERSDGVVTFTDGVLCAELAPDTGALRRAWVLPGAPQGHRLSLGIGREMLLLLTGVLDPSRPSPVNAPYLGQPCNTAVLKAPSCPDAPPSA